jgi:hypothetical protein
VATILCRMRASSEMKTKRIPGVCPRIIWALITLRFSTLQLTGRQLFLVSDSAALNHAWVTMFLCISDTTTAASSTLQLIWTHARVAYLAVFTGGRLYLHTLKYKCSISWGNLWAYYKGWLQMMCAILTNKFM